MILSSISGAVFFLSLLGYAFLAMLLLPRLKMGAALFSAFCAMLFAGYWLVILLQVMAPAAYGMLYGGLVALALGIVGIALDWRNIRKRILSVAFFGYVGVCCLVVLYYDGMAITEHDSYSFWMRAVKELFTFEGSYFNAQSNISHSDYNPIFAALQYCIVRVAGWRDAYLLYVIAAAIVTPLCAVSDLIQKKAYGALFLILSLAFYLVCGFDPGVLNVDGPLSVFFLGGLVCVCFREEEGLGSLLPGLCAIAILPALKLYSGLLFALVLLAALILQTRKGQSGEAGKIPPRVAVLACCLMLLMECSWSGFYHFQIRKVAYETQLAQDAFVGRVSAETVDAPRFELSDLVSGNPRNESMAHSITPENTRKVLALIAETADMYVHSQLPYGWLFWLGGLWILHKSKGAWARPIKTALWLSAAAFLCFTLGMFAGYYVQAEISGGAIWYLRAVTLPLVLLPLFLCVRAGESKEHQARIFARAGLVLLVVLAVAGDPARVLLAAKTPPGDEAVTYASHTSGFFQEEVSGLLLPRDAHARALLVDCTWDASQIKSKSGITHAYQYYALPMRLAVYQYPYGEYDGLENITREGLDAAIENNRSNLLILRIDDELYADAFLEALEVETDADMPWVFDVTYEGGAVAYTLRNQEE